MGIKFPRSRYFVQLLGVPDLPKIVFSRSLAFLSHNASLLDDMDDDFCIGHYLQRLWDLKSNKLY